MGADRWLTIKEYDDIPSCIAALRGDGRAIWATDLSPEAVPLASAAELAVSAARTATPAQPLPTPDTVGSGETLGIQLGNGLVVPPKLAVVVGREIDGVSPAMLAAADARVHLPIYGYSESYNLSVATALVLQRVMDAVPECRGDFTPARRDELRQRWFGLLGSTDAAKAAASKWAASAAAGVAPAPLTDLRRHTKNARIVKRIRRREEASEDTVGRSNIEAAVAAAGVPPVDGAVTQGDAKRARGGEGAADVSGAR